MEVSWDSLYKGCKDKGKEKEREIIRSDSEENGD